MKSSLEIRISYLGHSKTPTILSAAVNDDGVGDCVVDEDDDDNDDMHEISRVSFFFFLRT